jgi:hypothetical protein
MRHFRRRRTVNFGVLGEDRAVKLSAMNACHIGDDFTRLLYTALTSSVFLYKLLNREGGD